MTSIPSSPRGRGHPLVPTPPHHGSTRRLFQVEVLGKSRCEMVHRSESGAPFQNPCVRQHSYQTTVWSNSLGYPCAERIQLQVTMRPAVHSGWRGTASPARRAREGAGQPFDWCRFSGARGCAGLRHPRSRPRSRLLTAGKARRFPARLRFRSACRRSACPRAPGAGNSTGTPRPPRTT